MSLGSQIAKYRREKAMTQEALAQSLGVTNQAVSKWELEQACPDVMLLPRLADLFGITIDSLFERPAPETPQSGNVCVSGLPWEDDGALHVAVFLGHRLQKRQKLFGPKWEQVEFHYEGPALNVSSYLSVTCREGVRGNVAAGDSVTCQDVAGSVTASDSVTCGNVHGNVQAGDSVNCGNVEGHVQAGDSVRCGDIAGDVRAGDSIHCTGYRGR